MDARFKDIKALIWDFDGTFYKRNEVLWQEIRHSEYQVIANHTGWNAEKVIGEFNKIYTTSHSGTTTAAKLSGISVKAAAAEGEHYINREKYISRDQKLIEMFDQLSKFRHYMLVNGVRTKTEKFLRILGVDPEIFTDIVTSEIVGVNKPELEGFRYIMQNTGLAPEKHLMIGDREEVDLVPAKKLGMKTCLVWSTKKSEQIDVAVSTVYEVCQLLL